LSFALFWFLLNLLIESTIIPLELIFEHRMYLPSAFLFIAAAGYLEKITHFRLALFHPALLLLVSLLAVLTWMRNSNWQTEIKIWTDVTQKAPGLARGYINLGKAYSLQGDLETAAQHYRKAIALDQQNGVAYYNLGVFYDLTNRLPEALATFELALTKKHINPAQVHNSLGIVHRKLGNPRQAIQEAQIALSLDPEMIEAYITLGICFENQGQSAKALLMLAEAAAHGLDTEDLHNNWAISLASLGRFEQAIAHLKHAIELNPKHFESTYNLGVMYSRIGMMPEADQLISRALALKNSSR
jgi:tetratricopeptide (TPR) repeat protein